MSVCCCLFRYPLCPETFGYTLVYPLLSLCYADIGMRGLLYHPMLKPDKRISHYENEQNDEWVSVYKQH